MNEEQKNVNETEEMEDNLVVLVDEDDQERVFEIIDVITVEDQPYAVLAPHEENDDDSAIVLKIVDEDGNDMLYDIEDDEEWAKVVDHWNALIDEEEA